MIMHRCLFVETSAKANLAVGQAFQELLLKVAWLAHCGREVTLWWCWVRFGF
jgi:hypothetical protein